MAQKRSTFHTLIHTCVARWSKLYVFGLQEDTEKPWGNPHSLKENIHTHSNRPRGSNHGAKQCYQIVRHLKIWRINNFMMCCCGQITSVRQIHSLSAEHSSNRTSSIGLSQKMAGLINTVCLNVITVCYTAVGPTEWLKIWSENTDKV